MILLLASDHAGFELKRLLADHAREMGHEVVDLGPDNQDAVDYPDFAHILAQRIAGGQGECGVLICGTGIGMSMTANRHPGVRAALCHDAFTAEFARRHNNANVLCMGGRTTGPGIAVQMLDIFLATGFDGGRHERRIGKIDAGRADRGPESGRPTHPKQKGKTTR
jgi:RpiB/LacA/LacB family sugar-phosphate isomerase